MKAPIDIADALLARATRQAQQSGTPLRAVVEEDAHLAAIATLHEGGGVPDQPVVIV